MVQKDYSGILTDEVSGIARFKLAFLSVVVFFFIGNGYAFFNVVPIHDAIIYVYEHTHDWQIQLGRFLIPFYIALRGANSAPFPILLLSTAYLGTSLYLVCLILDLRKKLEIVLTCAFLSVNAFTFEISAVHQYFADVFLLSLFFSCLAVFNQHKTITTKTAFLSFCLFFISFGLYPAFLTFDLCLFAAMLLKDICEGKSAEVKRKAPIWILTIFLAGLAYMFASRVALHVLQLQASKVNQSIFSLGRLSLNEIGSSIIKNYKEFVKLFFGNSLFSGWTAIISTSLLLIVSICVFLYQFPVKVSVLTIVMLLVFPFVSRLVNIMTENLVAYRTMYAQFLLLPILIWLFFQGIRKTKTEIMKKVLTMLVVLFSSVIIWMNIQFTNAGFVYQKIMYDRSIYHVGQVLESINEYENKGDIKPVLIIGGFQLKQDKEFSNYNKIEGFGSGIGVNGPQEFSYFSSLMGFDLYLDYSNYDTLKHSPEIKTMPCYPKNGYINDVNGYLVVKLSD